MLQDPNHRMGRSSRTARLMLLGLLVASAARPAAAQPKYSVHDLGTLSGSNSFPPGPVSGIYAVVGINNAGEVIGSFVSDSLDSHAFRTAPNSVINTVTDDLGPVGGVSSSADAINNSGQVVGTSTGNNFGFHGFRTAPNSAINPTTDDLGAGFGFPICSASGINDSGQVVGICTLGMAHQNVGFRTAPNSRINDATDELGSLCNPLCGFTIARGINGSGQVVGSSGSQNHAFRTSGNSPINPATDDLGTLGGSFSRAVGINASGQTAGDSDTVSGLSHAFRTSANRAINAVADDLGTLGGSFSQATGINSSGQVVGSSSTASSQDHAFLYSGGALYDLNDLIPANSGWTLGRAQGINDVGQVVGDGLVNGSQHAFRLDPPPASFVSFLLDIIRSFPQSAGTETNLCSVLRAGLHALQRGDSIAARNQLGAFAHKVSALRGTVLTTTQADLLLNVVAQAIHLLS